MSQTEVIHPVDSIENVDHDSTKEKKQKSRRPANTAFRQQRLKAWQPILTPKTVVPIFLLLGVIFAPIGGVLLWASTTVQELRIDYTDCNSTAPSDDFKGIPDNKIHSSFKSSNSSSPPQWKKTIDSVRPPYSTGNISNTPICTIQFSIPNDIGPPVFLYYRLSNFYQNHRRYVKSLDTSQLKGNALSNSSIGDSSCNPLRTNGDGVAYYPCGLIANSIFNDTLNSPIAVNTAGTSDPTPYKMTNKSIAWGSDAQLYKKTKYNQHQVVPPPNWHRRYPNGYTDGIPDLSEYEEFQVWMRTAGLPTFSKIALRNEDDVMRAGRYSMDIYDYFPVSIYGGTKSILISTRTVMGGKNSFLGIAYLVIGGICIVLGVFFTAAHLVKPRKLGDHTYLSWNNNDAPATATATGRDSRPGTQHA